MADNVAITAGSGTTIAADDIGGVLHQRIKLGLGADGSATDALGGTGAASSAVLRTVSASDDPIVTAINTTNAQLPSSIGGTTAAGSLSVTRATDDLGLYTEDAAAAANPQGPVVLAVRRDTLTTAEVSADGDNVGLKATSKGQLHVMEEDGTAIASASLTATGTLVSADMTGFESVTVQITAFGVGVLAFQTSEDNSTWVSACSQNISLLGGSTTVISAPTAAGMFKTPKYGRYWRLQITGYTSGTFTAQGSLHKNPMSGLATSAYTGVTGNNPVVGAAAHDAAISGSPVRLSGRALTANYTAVATGDTADLVTDIVGSLVTSPYSIPDATWQYASAADVTDTTSTEMKAAVASTRNYLTSLTVSNTDATVGTYINILSAATVIYVCYVTAQVAATAGSNSFSITFPVPLRGAVNEALNFQAVTTSAQLRVASNGFAKAA